MGRLFDSKQFRTDLQLSGSFSGSFQGSGASLTDIPASAIGGLNLSQITSGSFSASITQNGNFSTNGVITGSGAGLTDIPASGIVGLNLSQIASGSFSASINQNGGLLVNTSISASIISGSTLVISPTGSFNHIITDGETIEFRNPSTKAEIGRLKFDPTTGLNIQDNTGARTKIRAGRGEFLSLEAGLIGFNSIGSITGSIISASSTIFANDIEAFRMNVTHLTSSFITASTIETSGSNIFGDEASDTHTFVGDIIAQNNISSSGYISGSVFSGDGSGLINIPASGITGLNLSQIASGSVTASIAPDKGLVINTNISSSGFISASHIHLTGGENSVITVPNSTSGFTFAAAGGNSTVDIFGTDFTSNLVKVPIEGKFQINSYNTILGRNYLQLYSTAYLTGTTAGYFTIAGSTGTSFNIGARLGVIGTTNDNAASALKIQNSDSVDILDIVNDKTIKMSGSTQITGSLTMSGSISISDSGSGITISSGSLNVKRSADGTNIATFTPLTDAGRVEINDAEVKVTGTRYGFTAARLYSSVERLGEFSLHYWSGLTGVYIQGNANEGGSTWQQNFIGGGLHVGSRLTAANNFKPHAFSVRGPSQLSGSLLVSSSLDVIGNTQITGSLNVSGSLEVQGDFNPHPANLSSNNIGIGLVNNNLTGGSYNVFMGYEAGRYGSLPQNNVAVGRNAGFALGTGQNNVFVGYRAGYANGTTGASYTPNNNTAVGAFALDNMLSGDYNVALGYRAGDAVTGAGNLMIGYEAGASLSSGDGNIFIGSGSLGADTPSNQLRIGNGNSLVTISASLATGDLIFSNNVTLNGGTLSIRNKGAQSEARFYCEVSNAHYTALKAQPHALYSGNPVTLLPAYDLDFAKPKFEANITASANISSSGYVSASIFVGDGSQLTGISTTPFPYAGDAVISGSLTVSGSFVDFASASSVTLPEATVPLINPVVEYVDCGAITSSGTTVPLPNGLTFVSSSVYEYIEIFINGLRMRYDVDFAPRSTSTIEYFVTIPSGSEITYKSLRR